MTYNPIGDLPEIINNYDELYEGDLIHYFKVLFFEAQNVNHPYHNFRHMTHVLWLCYDACKFYKTKLTARVIRNILVGAMFHDFDHSGLMGHDDLNIERAVRGFGKHVHSDDVDHKDDIIFLIRGSEFPHTSLASESLDILRDADLAQSLSNAWMQQVVFGLAKEWGKTPLEVLKMQPAFYRGITFKTAWAKQRFPEELVSDKLVEVEDLLLCLTHQ